MFNITIPDAPGVNLGDGIVYDVLEYILYGLYLIAYFLTAPVLALAP